jgi:hypothetical protein
MIEGDLQKRITKFLQVREDHGKILNKSVVEKNKKFKYH